MFAMGMKRNNKESGHDARIKTSQQGPRIAYTVLPIFSTETKQREEHNPKTALNDAETPSLFGAIDTVSDPSLQNNKHRDVGGKIP